MKEARQRPIASFEANDDTVVLRFCLNKLSCHTVTLQPLGRYHGYFRKNKTDVFAVFDEPKSILKHIVMIQFYVYTLLCKFKPPVVNLAHIPPTFPPLTMSRQSLFEDLLRGRLICIYGFTQQLMSLLILRIPQWRPRVSTRDEKHGNHPFFENSRQKSPWK